MVDTPNEPTAESAVASTINTSEPVAEGSSMPQTTPPSAGAYSAGDWQAIWSQPHNAYYFYNSVTKETTWANPLEQQQQATEPNDGSLSPSTDVTTSQGSIPSSLPSSSSWNTYQMQAAAMAQGIDPSLAHLDPSLAGPSSIPGGTFTAKFNARTGTFARTDARDPTHLSEYERAKRMSEFYFDVDAWEKELEYRNTEQYKEEEEKKRKKKLTKKDLDRFKEQKRLKKIAKTAWLRT